MKHLLLLLIINILILDCLSNAFANDLSKSLIDKSSLAWSCSKNLEQQDIKALSAEDDTTRIQTLFFIPRIKQSGSMWDTWLYYHEGNYYLYYLGASHRKKWDNISMARSPDGVHWTEIGPVLFKDDDAVWMGTGSTWKSPNFKSDGKFVMNFSQQKEGEPQHIYFAESKDLIHWNRLGEEYKFVQDERWYDINGRWDCIWAIPIPNGGYYGYWTANPTTVEGEFGFGESLDGVSWKALKSPKVIDAGIEGGRRHGEVGAVEKIGDKYYMLFGHYPYMVTLIADHPYGPFQKAKKNYKLLSGNTYFSRFVRAPEGLLVNHHSIGNSGNLGEVFFGTLKATHVDAYGTLRLIWWQGNEKLKKEIIRIIQPSQNAKETSNILMIEPELDVTSGIIMEGKLRLPQSENSRPVGLYIEENSGQGTGILVHANGITEIGNINSDGTGFIAIDKIDREWKYGKSAHFRLLMNGSLLEFYLDDQLIQCYTLPHKASGEIGLILGGKVKSISNIKAWRCFATRR